MDEPTEQRKRPRRTLKSLAWGSVAVLGAGLLVTLAVPLSSTLFPAEEVVSCTVTEHPTSPRGRRGGINFYPRIYSDCGVFRASKQAACTADPELDTNLIPGYTYDFTVRGANLPALLSREIVSANVSSKQLAKPIELLTPLEADAGNDLLNKAIEEAKSRPESRAIDEKINELAEQFSPEVLRAFDYEQPAFTPACDISRNVMTSKGLQIMTPDRAKETLTLPEGAVAREPLLPCEGYLCNPQFTP